MLKCLMCHNSFIVVMLQNIYQAKQRRTIGSRVADKTCRSGIIIDLLQLSKVSIPSSDRCMGRLDRAARTKINKFQQFIVGKW